MKRFSIFALAFLLVAFAAFAEQEKPQISATTFTSTAASNAVLMLNGDSVNWVQPVYRIDNVQNVQVAAAFTKRLVRVIIADPDPNVPLDKSILYEGTEELTDLDNDELFYKIGIGLLLEKHNAYRKLVLNKAESSKFGRDIFLQPIRIRDLKMVVVEIARI